MSRLGEGDRRGEQRGQRADDRDRPPSPRPRDEERRQRQQQVDARGDHGGGVDERRDRRRAGHGVGQPDVERDLRALAGAAEEEEQAGDRGEARHHAGIPNGPSRPGTGRSPGAAALISVELEACRRTREQDEHADENAEVADAVDDERLLAGRGVVAGSRTRSR